MEKTANEKTPKDPRDVIHKNEIMLGTEHWIAEPGVRTYSDLGLVVKDDKFTYDLLQVSKDVQDIQQGAAWKTSEYRRNFSHDKFPFPVEEGGLSMITGAYMDLEFENKDQSAMKLHLGAMKGHSWFFIARAFPRDYKIDTDPNAKIIATNFNTGFVDGTMLPPGQYVSEDYFKQNVKSAHGKFGAQNSINCGADGCTGVSAVMFDIATGGFTWINQESVNAPWKLVQTNIKSVTL